MNAMLHGSTATTSMDELKAHLDASPHEFAVVLGSVGGRATRPWTSPGTPRINRPDLGVILLRHGVDSETLTSALRSGMREVVEARDLAGLTTAVHRARSVAKEISQTLEDDARAAADAASPRPAEARAAAPGRRRRPAGQGHHGLLHQGRRRQEPGRHQPRRRAERAGPPGLPGRPRRQQRRRRDHAPAHPDTHDQRPRRASTDSIDAEALRSILTTALGPPLAGRGAGPPGLPRPRRGRRHRRS